MQALSGHIRFTAALAGALACVVALAGCSSSSAIELDVPAQTEAALPAATQEELQDAVEFAMAATGSSVAAVGVWAPWSGEWVASLGDDAQEPGALTFRAADLTRAMTCDVLYELVEEGVVGLDDSVSDYVSSVAGLEAITLKQLCDGTSGLGSYEAVVGARWIATPERQWNPRELVSFGIAQSSEDAPGTVYAGADAGYVLLGLALESATQKSARALYEEYVFEPLDMSSSLLPSDIASTPGDNPLPGFVSLPGEDGALNCADPTNITTLSPTIGFTNAGVVSSLDDLHTYAQALATQALTPDASARFASPLPVGGDLPSWFTATGGAYQAGSLIGQYGSVPGYIVAAFADPTTGMTVVVALNNSAADERVGAYLAWELAALASKAPAASGETAPDAGLPWTAQQFADAIAAAAVCPLPEEPVEEPAEQSAEEPAQ